MQAGKWTCLYEMHQIRKLSSYLTSPPVDLTFETEQLSKANMRLLDFKLVGEGASSTQFNEKHFDLNFLKGKVSASYYRDGKLIILPVPLKISAIEQKKSPITLRISWPRLRKVAQVGAWHWQVRVEEQPVKIKGFAGDRYISKSPIILTDNAKESYCAMMPVLQY